MKEDVIDLFFKSPYTEEGHFKNKAEYMKKELEFKYGWWWQLTNRSYLVHHNRLGEY